jgi:hypothetical protein
MCQVFIFLLAILSYFCNAKRVKKYFKLSFLLFLFSFGLMQNLSLIIPKVALAAEYYACDCDDEGNTGNFMCTQDLGDVKKAICPNSNKCMNKDSVTINGDKYNGISCVAPQQSANIQCKCQYTDPNTSDPQNGSLGDGRNGFTCSYPNDPSKSTNYNIFCDSSDQACVNDPNKSLVLTDTNVVVQDSSKWDDYNGTFKGKTVNGISCETTDTQKARIPISPCHCKNPGTTGDGSNEIICPGVFGDNGDKVFCERSYEACIEGKDKNILMKDGIQQNSDPSHNVTFEGNTDNWDKKIQGRTAQGVACEGSADPPLPPPPSPPCKTWTNGECTAFSSGIGDFSTTPSSFITSLFGIMLSFSGGIALLLIIMAGYKLMTSQGKPEQVQQGRDQLIAAIVGLLFLIFSFVLLGYIGFDILHIPGLSSQNSGGADVGQNCTVHNSTGKSNCAGGLTCITNGTGGDCEAANGTCAGTCR